MIDKLSDKELYQQRLRRAWAKNGAYWLSAPLRHVVDAGDFIMEAIGNILAPLGDRLPVVVDMGCGSCWLLDRLLASGRPVRYIGVDSNKEFIDSAVDRYSCYESVSFVLGDLNTALDIGIEADLVVNAFTFFELSSLDQAMANAASWLSPAGTMLMSTIDKTYLILALSSDWEDFHENLRTYQEFDGVKYGFQKIDLGDGPSADLEYPSVLYSTQDFILSAERSNLKLTRYREQPFTARAIPKIYSHLEFSRSR